MIKQLHIEHYAIIDKLDLDFRDGFSVFTGETGAGKSIIIGALSYLFGMRADTGVISHGEKACVIEGTFTVSEAMKFKLNEIEIPYMDDEIIVRRIISEDHSTIRINERAVTLSFLQLLFAGETDIHSQNDNQYLLKNQNHLRLLDNYLRNHVFLAEYSQMFQEYKNAKLAYEKMLEEDFNDKDLEFLRYNLRELMEANIRVGEEEELLQSEKRLKSSEKLLKGMNEAIQEYQREGGASESLYQICKSLEVNDDELAGIASNIQDMIYNLDEEMKHVSVILNNFDTDEGDIDIISERLYTLSRLKRKYNTDEEGLLAEITKIEKQLDYFNNKEKFIKEHSELLRLKKEKAESLAKELHLQRVKAARNLEKEVVGELTDLLLPNAQFSIHFQEAELGNNGIDDVEFRISMNKGEALRPLAKVASGGELSRLMLGLKTIFTRLSSIGLCVFDEIDSGVSGQVALAMGQKMSTISKNAQVLTITHLPSVAACAANHFYIYKNDEAERTITHIKTLSTEEKIYELARLSGNIVSSSSLEAAKELHENARKLCHED